MSAAKLLEKAAGHLKNRAATYDKPDGERSIGATVQAFNAITGDGLMNSEERGWLFMAVLKMVRSQQGNYKADNYEDLAAYSALMGESACEERNGGWTPEAIKQAAFDTGIPVSAAFKPDCEYTLEQVIGESELSDWARWVAVDGDGEVYEYSGRPVVALNPELWAMSDDDDKWNWIKDIEPPLDFTKCIWEVKN